MTTCLATSLWAQLPFSFSGTAGDACIPAQDPYIQPWPGVAGPDGSVRFAWSVTNTEATPKQLEVQVVRDSYSVPPSTIISAITVHSFTVTAAPNATTTGEAFWT